MKLIRTAITLDYGEDGTVIIAARGRDGLRRALRRMRVDMILTETQTVTITKTKPRKL